MHHHRFDTLSNQERNDCDRHFFLWIRAGKQYNIHATISLSLSPSLSFQTPPEKIEDRVLFLFHRNSNNRSILPNRTVHTARISLSLRYFASTQQCRDCFTSCLISSMHGSSKMWSTRWKEGNAYLSDPCSMRRQHNQQKKKESSVFCSSCCCCPAAAAFAVAPAPLLLLLFPRNSTAATNPPLVVVAIATAKTRRAEEKSCILKIQRLLWFSLQWKRERRNKQTNKKEGWCSWDTYFVHRGIGIGIYKYVGQFSNLSTNIQTWERERSHPRKKKKENRWEGAVASIVVCLCRRWWKEERESTRQRQRCSILITCGKNSRYEYIYINIYSKSLRRFVIAISSWINSIPGSVIHSKMKRNRNRNHTSQKKWV